MITMSGMIATLFMGFGSVVITSLSSTRFDIIIPASVFLMAEVILTTFTITYSLSAFKLQAYSFALGHENFFDGAEL